MLTRWLFAVLVWAVAVAFVVGQHDGSYHSLRYPPIACLIGSARLRHLTLPLMLLVAGNIINFDLGYLKAGCTGIGSLAFLDTLW